MKQIYCDVCGDLITEKNEIKECVNIEFAGHGGSSFRKIAVLKINVLHGFYESQNDNWINSIDTDEAPFNERTTKFDVCKKCVADIVYTNLIGKPK